MAKRRSAKSPITRSPDHPITGSESPDPSIIGSASPDESVKGSPKVPFNWRDAIPVLGYQYRWIKDDSKLKIAVWSRQSGKSFAAALRAVVKCSENHTQYIILSKGERQSRMFMEKVRDFCQAFKELKVLREFRLSEESDDKTMEVYFPHNGSRIIGLPANPDTARGYSGHIVLDEFAFHGDARKIFSACFPIITRGYSIEVISTPNGTAGKFYEIAKQAGLVGLPIADGRLPIEEGRIPTVNQQSSIDHRQLWSGHRVDIYDAVAQGLPANIDLLRSGCDDEETWLQEYGCQFLSDAQNYIPVELISTCVHEEATTEWPIADGRLSIERQSSGRQSPIVNQPLAMGNRQSAIDNRQFFLGVDIGRKRDLTVAWLFEKVGGILWSRVLLTLKGVSFDEQEKAICRLIEGTPHPSSSLGHPLPRGEGSASSSLVTHHSSLAFVRRCCIDQSGIGMMLAEHLVQKYGAIVEPTTFTAQLKERLAPMVKMAFEERTVRIPDNREVRADINSVKRFVTLAGNVRFDAEHTDRGHADRFWALAQVVSASSEAPAHFEDVAGLVGSPVMAGFAEMIL
jgi:phage FluMu gp28-like protein